MPVSKTKLYKNALRDLGVEIPEGFGQWPSEAQNAFCEAQTALHNAKKDAERAKNASPRSKLTRREKFMKAASGDQAQLVEKVLDDLNSFEKSSMNSRKRARYETLRVIACLYKRNELSPAMREKIESTFPDA